MDNINVLIVEDESIVALDLKNTLSKLNYNVLDIATSGAGAISKARELNPDVILMDIMLKGDMDGVNTTKEINSRFDIPIVYLSAYSDKNTLKRVNKTNYYSYISKPFEEKDLCIKLRMAVYSHRLKKEFDKKLELFYKVFNKINDPLIILDKDDNISFVNDFFIQISEKNLDEILKRKIKDIFNNFDYKNNLFSISNNDFIQFFFENEENKIIFLKKIFNKDFEYLEDKITDLSIKINNIFTLIMGNIELCKIKSDTQNYEYYELLKDTQNKLNELNEINNNIIGFDNKYDKKTIIDLKKFISNKFFYIKDINFSKNTNFYIKFDESSLFKVLNSVIKNSFEASSSNNFNISINVIKENSYVKIKISDNGIGINEKNINKIFEPFFTTKNNHKGLGLTICKALLKKYNSEIFLNSSIPNKETTFTIVIPEYK
ncbi:MAG: hypothetical protein KatS3mg068_2620 [Candidatus Sericytochromatia bacterium]|nr:MAG: hypothetical protein KatS3mg068_2620 [Candidatus Sericytochromatia bacterium]